MRPVSRRRPSRWSPPANMWIFASRTMCGTRSRSASIGCKRLHENRRARSVTRRHAEPASMSIDSFADRCGRCGDRDLPGSRWPSPAAAAAILAAVMMASSILLGLEARLAKTDAMLLLTTLLCASACWRAPISVHRRRVGRPDRLRLPDHVLDRARVPAYCSRGR